MKRNRLLLGIFGLIFLCNPFLYSQTPERVVDLLVSTDWLEENLSDSLLVILHSGKRTEYEKEHIPGARYISIRELLVEDEQGRRHELPDEEQIEGALRSSGLNNNSRIIICYQDGNAIPMAARLFYTLDYAGLGDQVAILSGGLKTWKSEERSVTQNVPAHKQGMVDINIKAEVRVSKDDVLASLHKEGVSIIDARPEEQYYGTNKDHNSKRLGHIEGAVNIPFFTLTQDDSPHLFKTKDELRKLFEKHKISADSTIITYCGTGIWASPVYFAARLLGYKVRFYDGSFQEWGNDESLPVSN